jgi:hypothetical protein
MQEWGKFCPMSVSNTVIRPKFLNFVREFDVAEGWFVMSIGKGNMFLRMPILGDNNMREKLLMLFECVDVGEDFATVGNSKGATFTEIVLDVDYK